MTDIDELFDPPKPTPGAVHCAGSHYDRAIKTGPRQFTWLCINCGAERVMSDGKGWR